MSPEGGEVSKVAENIVTMVTMETDMEEVSEDNAAEAQDYFKEGYSPELAQVSVHIFITRVLQGLIDFRYHMLYASLLQSMQNHNLIDFRWRPFWMRTPIFSRTTSSGRHLVT